MPQDFLYIPGVIMTNQPKSRSQAVSTLVDDFMQAVDSAYAQALADHQAGVCHLSEWSCSHCEREQRA